MSMVQPLADNTILHLSELETGGVRLFGHQITNHKSQERRVVLLVVIIGRSVVQRTCNNRNSKKMDFKAKWSMDMNVFFYRKH